MSHLFRAGSLVLLLTGPLHGLKAEQPVLMNQATVLPLALEDGYEFRKSKIYNLTPRQPKELDEPMLAFERKRGLFGAINELDREERYGQIFTFFWRAPKPETRVEIRFEYRQAKLGNFVQAQALAYDITKPMNVRSEFRVVGDDYAEEGSVTAWRAIVIENGKIVALTQSALWR